MCRLNLMHSCNLSIDHEISTAIRQQRQAKHWSYWCHIRLAENRSNYQNTLCSWNSVMAFYCFRVQRSITVQPVSQIRHIWCHWNTPWIIVNYFHIASAWKQGSWFGGVFKAGEEGVTKQLIKCGPCHFKSTESLQTSYVRGKKGGQKKMCSHKKWWDIKWRTTCPIPILTGFPRDICLHWFSLAAICRHIKSMSHLH